MFLALQDMSCKSVPYSNVRFKKGNHVFQTFQNLTNFKVTQLFRFLKLEVLVIVLFFFFQNFNFDDFLCDIFFQDFSQN